MIVFLIIFALVLYGAEKYSMAHGLTGLSFRTSTDQVVVEPGEPFSWTMDMANEKRMMVPYLKVREQVPAGLYFPEENQPVERTEHSGLTSSLYLAGKQRVSMTRTVALPQRGRHFFRGSSIEVGDFLGLKTMNDSRMELVELVVKPRAFKNMELSSMLGGFLGEHSVRKSLMEDPVITIGFRDYTGREPFRAISWTQSAKHNRLLVKQYDCTADFSCTVLLNTDSKNDGGRNQRPETCYSMVRTVCEELERRKISYDFKTNGVIAGAIGNWRQVDQGLGAGHLETVLEGLGRMTTEAREPLDEFIRKAARQTRPGQSLILITPDRTDAVTGLCGLLEEISGKTPLLLCAGEFIVADGSGSDGSAGNESLGGEADVDPGVGPDGSAMSANSEKSGREE